MTILINSSPPYFWPIFRGSSCSTKLTVKGEMLVTSNLLFHKWTSNLRFTLYVWSPMSAGMWENGNVAASHSLTASWFQVSCGKALRLSWLGSRISFGPKQRTSQSSRQPARGQSREECNPCVPLSVLLLAAASEHAGANIPLVAHYSLLGQWERGFYEEDGGGGYPVFLPNGGREFGGFARLQMWSMRRRQEGENPPWAYRVHVGGSKSFQLVKMWRKSWRQITGLNICLQKLYVDATLWLIALWKYLFSLCYAAQSADSKHAVGSVRRLHRRRQYRSAVGPCVEVAELRVFLFQRDFFTVCFSSTLCVWERRCVSGHGAGHGCIPVSWSPRIQLMADLVLAP